RAIAGKWGLIGAVQPAPRQLPVAPGLTIGRPQRAGVSCADEKRERIEAGPPRAGEGRRSVDVSHRIDGLAVAQHLEVQVRPGRTPGVAEPRDDLPALHGIADGDEVRRVMRIARDIAVAVVDLDELAIPLARAGPDHDAGADGHDLAALAAGEVDALMERSTAGERIRSLAEAGRDVAGRDGPPAGTHFVRELAVQQEILEHVE